MKRKITSLEYAPALTPDPSKVRDLISLPAIGTVFGVAYMAFLFWWTLYR